jgi:hypothetical protein
MSRGDTGHHEKSRGVTELLYLLLYLVLYLAGPSARGEAVRVERETGPTVASPSRPVICPGQICANYALFRL